MLHDINKIIFSIGSEILANIFVFIKRTQNNHLARNAITSPHTLTLYFKDMYLKYLFLIKLTVNKNFML